MIMNGTYPGFIPAPSTVMPKVPPISTYTDLKLDVDTSELVRLDQLRRRAANAVSELTAGRPGGQNWRDANAADVTALLADKPGTKLAKVMAGDPARWAAARVACDAFDVASRAGFAELKAATKLAVQGRLTELESELESTLAAGWSFRADKSLAWQHRQAAEKSMAQWRIGKAVLRWCDGQGYQVNRDAVPGGEIAGLWYSLIWLLDGVRQPGYSTMGGNMILPPGADAEVFGRQLSDMNAQVVRPDPPQREQSMMPTLTRIF